MEHKAAALAAVSVDSSATAAYKQMAAYRESWNSKWMGGSATNTTHSSAGFENRDRTAVAVEAALEPLPTWDGLACSTNYGDNYGRDPIAAESRRRYAVRLVHAGFADTY